MDQTRPPEQVIIVDDGPSPDVDRIVSDWAGRLDIKVVKHPKNLGTLQARITAAEQCETDYCIYLDPDDTLHPEALMHLLDSATRTDADLMCCGVTHFGVEGEVTLTLEPFSDEVVTFDKTEAFRNQFTFAGPEYKYAALSTGGGKFIRTRTLQAAIGELNEVPHIIYSEDTVMMFLILAKAQKICQLPKDLYEYRKRKTSVTHAVGVEHALRYFSDANWAMDRMEAYAKAHTVPDMAVTKMLFHNRRYIKITAITQRLGRAHWTPEELKNLYETLPEVLQDALYVTELELQTRNLKKRRYRLQDEAAASDKLIRSLKYRNRKLEAKLAKVKSALED